MDTRDTRSKRRTFLKGIGVAATIPLISNTVSAQSTETFTDTFEDNNIDGWVGSNISVSNESVEASYSLRATDGTGSVSDFPKWEGGPIIDLSEQFEISGVSQINQGGGSARSGFGLQKTNSTEGMLLLFSGQFNNTFLAVDGLEDYQNQDSYDTDFNQEWVKWRIVSESAGVVKAKVWNYNGQEPEGFPLEREFSTQSGRLSIWTGTTNNNRIAYLDSVSITGTERISENLSIETRKWLDYGESAEYKVYYTDPETGVRKDVTAEATISSSNPSVVSIDENTVTATATTNREVNEEIELTATYSEADSPARAEITVAAVSIENIDILPLSRRFQATFTDNGIAWLLATTILSVGVTRLTTSFGGLSIAVLFLTIGWLVGWISTGIALVGLFSALFIGLNLAANINYSVRQ